MFSWAYDPFQYRLNGIKVEHDLMNAGLSEAMEKWIKVGPLMMPKGFI